MKNLIQQHLCSRIFMQNGFGSVEALVEAINQACTIPEAEWRMRKDAFNQIAEKAPMTDVGYCLKYEDVPAFIQAETEAFLCTVNNGKVSSGMQPYSVIGIWMESGQLVCHHVEAESGENAFAQVAQNEQGLSMVVAMPGHIHEGENLVFPGDGVVDAETILGQPDVFGLPLDQN